MSEVNWISLDGVVNMRDVAGLPTAEGDTVQPGRLIRSDNLQDLSESDIRWLVDQLGLSDIIDLRSPLELRKEGAADIHAEATVMLHQHSFFVEDSTETGVPDDELPWADDFGDVDDRPAQDHDIRLRHHYLGYFSQRPDSIVAGLRAIAGASGAALVHCAAGKDRTGTLVALALSVVGVSRDHLLDDYEATNERIELVFRRLISTPTYARGMQGQSPADQMTPADAMRMVLEVLDERYGGVLGWLTAQGWTANDTEQLRRKLLQP